MMILRTLNFKSFLFYLKTGYNCQLIGLILFSFKYSFVLLKGFDPKNPFRALKGDGCADVIIKCLGLVINSFFVLAKFPHR